MIQTSFITRRTRGWLPPAVIATVLLGGLGACDYTPPEITGMTADSAFVTAIIPVLEDQCEDCHFAGGPMYKKMPFDDFEVVSSLEDALVTQLGGKGRDRVKEWLALVREERTASESSLP